MRNALAVILLLAAAGGAGELENPVRLEADGRPIDVTGGHAAPTVVDFDADGTRDLLVGQFLGEGRNPFAARMRVYKGVDGKLTKFRYLANDGVEASVPSG